MFRVSTHSCDFFCFIVFCFVVALSSVAMAQATAAQANATEANAPQVIEIPTASPEEVGMSTSKLRVVDETMQKFVDDGEMVGGIVMIARKGKVCFFEDYGMADRDEDQAMNKDSILRFYSMSKAITTAAALMLHDEGKLSVEEPVSKYIPGLAKAEVYAKGELKPAKNQMTIADLMRHTSGLTYGWSEDGLAKLHNKANPISRKITLEEMEARLGDVPLRFEPATGWNYGISTDVLGRVIEVASGEELESFLKTRLFAPLDMRDTGFHVPPEKQIRFVECYGPEADGFKPLPLQHAMFLSPPAFKSGGGGLLSTARDYMRFLMMIHNGGELHGRRYLKPETVRLMTTNQIPEGAGWVRIGKEIREGVGFGLGFSVREKMSDWDPGGRVGEYGWGGAASTHYWISPKDDLIVITLEQVMPYRWLTEFGLKKRSTMRLFRRSFVRQTICEARRRVGQAKCRFPTHRHRRPITEN